MEKSKSDSLSNVTRVGDLGSPRQTLRPQHAPFTVIVWDHRDSRLQVIKRIVAECGARTHEIASLSAIEPFDVDASGIALIAIGPHPSVDAGALDAIRCLKQKGCKIIGYENGAHSWPLGVQCLPLVAGAFRLLDSGKPDFVVELRRHLQQLLHAQTTMRGEEEQIRIAMNELGIVGESQAMISIFRWIRRASVLSDLPILITGETGTGKQMIANAIYRLDPKRRNGPFVAVNCGAISPNLAESELFGHRRGAFTGADRDRKGLIRSAHGGTLFLDEIGELDDTLQTKLLRILQERRVLGVGEDRESSVDIRVIAATNQDLEQMLRQRKFRVDLFHRLNVLSVHVPPLRERPADVKPLVHHFLRSYGSLNPSRSNSPGADFIEALGALELPGNVRQLENLVRQAIIQKNDDGALSLSDLPLEVWRQLAASRQHPPQSGEAIKPAREMPGSRAEGSQRDMGAGLVQLMAANGWSLSQCLRYCERLFLEAALQATHGNQSRTARMLGITPRSVYNKYRKHNLLR